MIIEFLSKINDLIWNPLLIMLLGLGIFITIKFKFIQIKLLPEGIRQILSKENTNSKNITPIQAFLVGLASRIGAGNITGVATAVMLGGAGSIFWMWVIAFIVASLSFLENTLGQIYKEKEQEKGYIGGPAFYMANALNMKWMAIVFSIATIATYGIGFTSIQANTIGSIITSTINVENTIFFTKIIGFILMILVAVILLGGSKKIIKVSSLMVPVMSVGYLLLAIMVITINIDKLPEIIKLIFTEAFNPHSITGATIGGIIIIGAKRGMFSNEAGMGSAPNAAATAETSHPVKQGLVQMVGVFIDTLVICTATGLIILTSLSTTEFANFSNQAVNDPSFNAVVVTQQSLISSLGNWSGYLLMIFIFFFSFSSILGNYFYTESPFEYLTKNTKHLFIFKIFIIFVVYWGTVMKIQILWSLSDILMGVMAILNIIAITLLYKYAFLALKDYNKQRKQGKNPVFKEENIKGLKGTVWK